MKRLPLPAVLLLIANLLPGCGPGSAPDSGSWITKLSGLPPHVRQGVLEAFDAPRSRRGEHPGLPRIEKETITDDRNKFDPTCSAAEGYSKRLFLRAKEAAGSWIVEYEYGGIVQETNVLVLSPDKAGILHRKALADIGLRTPDAGAAVSILLQKGRISP